LAPRKGDIQEWLQSNNSRLEEGMSKHELIKLVPIIDLHQAFEGKGQGAIG
jgi:hypothetical protein